MDYNIKLKRRDEGGGKIITKTFKKTLNNTGNLIYTYFLKHVYRTIL